ncbi:MAG: DNA-formamidopyrimidine glycosylase [candidate division KSB1 bacterium]|nr:DNA-formamidopyrimidine glycosylase [candidate division KSB1 bacterium]
MPELPEVETIVRQLQEHLIGKVIARVEILRPSQWKQNDPTLISGQLIGAKITRIHRRAKFILVDFHLGCQLMIHLRMTGKLIWAPKELPPDKFTRTIFFFTDGSSLHFSDTRALGRLVLLNCSETAGSLARLGIEPLSPAWQIQNIKPLFKQSRLTMKDFLLDQTKIAGIGNIYANEILFRAGIHPERRALTLTDEETERLFHIIPKVLELAIEKMGTSIGDKISDYRSVYNEQGEFQNILAVYGREGKPCLKCGARIIRIKQKSRSSFVCENCQK